MWRDGMLSALSETAQRRPHLGARNMKRRSTYRHARGLTADVAARRASPANHRTESG